MRQGRLILAAGRVRSKKKNGKKQEIPGDFLIAAHTKKQKEKKNQARSFLAFSTWLAVS